MDSFNHITHSRILERRYILSQYAPQRVLKTIQNQHYG